MQHQKRFKYSKATNARRVAVERKKNPTEMHPFLSSRFSLSLSSLNFCEISLN